MNDKERLQRIKEGVSDLKYFINLKPEFYEDMEWLFEKAELAINADEVLKQTLEVKEWKWQLKEKILSGEISL
mgnify:CR=1 FL=1